MGAGDGLGVGDAATTALENVEVLLSGSVAVAVNETPVSVDKEWLNEKVARPLAFVVTLRESRKS